MKMVAKRLRITGRVQGVWYRAWTAEQAQALGLSGFVRNRKDGSVEAVLKGPAETVQAMISKCHDGPPLAQVEDIVVEETQGMVADIFRTLPTV